MARAAQKEPVAPRIPIAEDPARLTAAARRVAARISAGRVFKQFVQDDRIPRGVAFFLEQGGGTPGCRGLRGADPQGQAPAGGRRAISRGLVADIRGGR